jgi:hypothetical protein
MASELAISIRVVESIVRRYCETASYDNRIFPVFSPVADFQGISRGWDHLPRTGFFPTLCPFRNAADNDLPVEHRAALSGKGALPEPAAPHEESLGVKLSARTGPQRTRLV